MTPIRVLIVEDSSAAAETLVHELERGGYEVFFTRVDSAESMTQALESGAWDLVLSDHVMPHFNAFKALELLQARHTDLPFILVSGAVEIEIAIDLMKAGANDYIAKGQWTRLVPAVARELRESALLRDQHRAQEALRHSQTRYRDLVETIQDWIWEVDAHGIYTYVSPRVQVILGYRPEELIGHSFFSVISPAETQRVQTLFQEALHRREPFVFLENVYQHKDGQVVTSETSGKPFFSEEGVLRGYRGVDRDITERKRVEETLRLNEARLETLVQLAQMNRVSPQVIMEFALEQGVCLTKSTIGYLAFTNAEETVLKMHAWSLHAMAECMVKNPTQIYPIEATGLWGEAVRQRKPVITNDYTAANPLKKGLPEGHIPIRRHLNIPVLDGDHIVLVAGVANKTEAYDESDVKQLTLLMDGMWKLLQRKRAEDAARETMETLQALIKASPLAIQTVDREGRTRLWNPAAERMFGWTAPEILGQTNHIVPPDQLAKYQAMYERVFHGDSFTLQEAVGLCKDGSAIQVHVSIAPLFNSQSEVNGAVVVMADITHQKQLEANFLRAQRLESLGTLASGVAHDLNNVLSPILMSVQFLHETVHDDTSRTLLATLESSARRGAKIIQQLLTFGRGIHGDRILLQPKHLLKEMVHIAQETFPKSISVQLDYPEQLWTISGDATQLHQVILNLCINARDAMPDGGRLQLKGENVSLDEAYARMNPEAKAGPYVLITVTDTGLGIPSALHDKIFEPFFTTKPAGESTGLGLTTALGIVKAHGGFLQVRSEPGMGAQFKIYLPASPTETPHPTEQEPSEKLSGQQEMVLVVDDEPVVREITQQTLEKNGYRVVTANDGAEAMAIFAQNAKEIRLVLTDMMMPFMDGTATIRALRKIHPQIPIVAASGLLTQNPELESAGITVEGWLPKPFTAEQLLCTLRGALSKRPATRAGLNRS